ncbi:MAG: MarC family protein [Candidatus Nitrospinota bacterium M3_3B_026]
MESLALFLNSFVTLFSILDPFGAAVTLIALSPRATDERRTDEASRAVRAAGGTLVVFMLFGGTIFTLFGITVQALQVAGGLILAQVAFRMLAGESVTYKSSESEMSEAELRDDVAIIPLAVPMLAGPAAITAVMVFAGRAEGFLDWAALFGSLGLVLCLTWLILKKSGIIADWLGELGVRILIRLMGLVLIAMGAEFTLSGLKGYFGW